MTKASTAVVALALAAAVGPQPARAQFFNGPGGAAPAPAGNIEGFTVSGKGVASAKPNRLEIDLEVTASSELTADAIVKYRDAKKRLREAYAALKLGNVVVEERGLLVDQKGAQFNPYFFDFQPNRRNKTEVQLTRKLVVKCDDIRSMDEEALLQLVAKLLDVAQDAGGRVGGSQNAFNPYFYDPFNNRQSSGLVRFILDDLDKLEQEAYEKAVADAGARAQRLAKLSRVKLGPVSAVREGPAPGEKPPGGDDGPETARRLESPRFQEIPVRIDLLVRFDVAGAPATNGRAGDR